MKPPNGRFWLIPYPHYDMPPYVVEVDDAGCRRPAWGPNAPWHEEDGKFWRETESGTRFGWTCGGSTYSHWSLPPDGGPITLDSGTCGPEA